MFICIFFLAFKGWWNAKQQLNLNLNPQVLLLLFVIRLQSIIELPTSHLIVQNQVVWINLISLQEHS